MNDPLDATDLLMIADRYEECGAVNLARAVRWWVHRSQHGGECYMGGWVDYAERHGIEDAEHYASQPFHDWTLPTD